VNHARNILTVMLATTFAASAGAQALTSTEVRAQFDEARRNGELLAPGETGLKMNELHPDLYPKRVATPGKTRGQVQAEVADAARNGELLAAGEGSSLFDFAAQQRSTALASAGKTREQVKAETLAAIRNGEIVTGESGLTLREQFPRAYARASTPRPADTDVASNPSQSGSSVR
jgi:hypothetical protein